MTILFTHKHQYGKFEVRHPRCVSNKSNNKVYVYIAKHNYILGGMLFTIRKAQLHVSALNVGHYIVLLGRKYLCQKKNFRSENLQIKFLEEIWLNKEITKFWVDSTVWVKKQTLLSGLFIDLKEQTGTGGKLLLFTLVARPVSDISRLEAKINLEALSMRADFVGRGVGRGESMAWAYGHSLAGIVG